jgi:hypothetical protein
MKRAGALLVSLIAAVSALGATASPIYAKQGDAWSNSDSFTSTCLGFTDTYPAQMYSLAKTQMGLLGYTMYGAIGPGFTRSAFLTNVWMDYAVYVHSHGDNYWAVSGPPSVDSGFLQDPGSGKCSSTGTDIVRASSVKTATGGTPYNLVVMSTCYLGSTSSTMPGAFQIEKMKTNSQKEFFLGYAHSTFDSSAFRFEKAFFTYLNGGPNHERTAYQAFLYAVGIGGYTAPSSAEPFEPNWWGNPNYNGVAG